MFQWISIFGLGAVIGLVLLHALIFPCGSGPRLSAMGLIRRGVHLLTMLFLEQQLTWIGRIRKLVYLLAMLAVLVLIVTGFGPVVFGSRIAGWLLMIHATFAGVFVFCMAFLAVTWANAFICTMQSRTSECGCPLEACLRRAGFWMMLLLTLPISLTMVLSMYPIFGTQGQDMLLWIHRYCTLCFVMVAIVQTYLVIRSRILKDCKTV